MREKLFTYKQFLEKLGIKGEFVAVKDIVASTKDPCPRIEVIYWEDSELDKSEFVEKDELDLSDISLNPHGSSDDSELGPSKNGGET